MTKSFIDRVEDTSILQYIDLSSDNTEFHCDGEVICQVDGNMAFLTDSLGVRIGRFHLHNGEGGYRWVFKREEFPDDDYGRSVRDDLISYERTVVARLVAEKVIKVPEVSE
jgi:hypothetical protein